MFQFGTYSQSAVEYALQYQSQHFTKITLELDKKLQNEKDDYMMTMTSILEKTRLTHMEEVSQLKQQIDNLQDSVNHIKNPLLIK